VYKRLDPHFIKKLAFSTQNMTVVVKSRKDIGKLYKIYTVFFDR